MTIPALLENHQKDETIDPHKLVERLKNSSEITVQQHLVNEYIPLLDVAGQDQVAAELKAQSGQFLRANIERCLQTASLIIYLSNVTEYPKHYALGLLAKANAYSIGLGEYREAIELYDEAAAIYETNGYFVEQATSQIGKIFALRNLNRTDEAIQVGQWASKVLEEHEAWFPLAKLTGNLGITYLRLGEDAQALPLFERAQELYSRVGKGNGPGWLRAEYNRAAVLRNLGRFDASMEASQKAYAHLIKHGQIVEAARAGQNLAITYFVLGRYNESLELLDQVREVFLTDGRQRDAILVELFISDCLLQLRRFLDVLNKCRRVRELFLERGAPFEVAQAILNEAVAYAGLRRYDEAINSFTEAHALFKLNGNPMWMTTTNLEMAAVLFHQGQHEASLTVAESCAVVFEEQSLPVLQSQALLVAAQAAFILKQHDKALHLVTQAVEFIKTQDMPSLTYQSYFLSGNLAAAKGNIRQALDNYTRSISELERLRGRLMIEFRADFLQDKQAAYEAAVGLCLDLNQPAEGLQFAERAKSRALLDLLAFRLELGINAKEERDQPIVAELMRLRAERDRLYRRWERVESSSEQRELVSYGDQQQAQQDVLVMEKRITDLWHTLLIRNADYARDAALWQVRTEPIQVHLDANTLLLEYFVTNKEIIVFLITKDSIETRRLPNHLTQIQKLLQLFHLNLRAVPNSHPDRIAKLTYNAQGLLHKLYQLLFAPIANMLNSHSRLIIVPHSSLHYLPFHALYDGHNYVLENCKISYLPSSSFLHYCQQTRQANSGLLAVGHSYNGRLPYTVQEASQLASTWNGKVLLEQEASREQVRELVNDYRVIHLATHGDFRRDDPLFSGLALADGWLTTFDIFNLRLNASLVTLSACQTGKNVIGGGDELLGLMRAFLSAGAISIIPSLWAVEDRSTAQLMQHLYEKLSQGWSKDMALQYAQQQFLNSEKDLDATTSKTYHHPYFWAPFFLVGNAGHL